MDNQQAKEVLRRYRPGIDLVAELEVEEALALIRRDPELDRWWTAQQAFHNQLRSGFRELPVPPALRDHILVQPEPPGRILGWPARPWLALAASLFLILGLASLWLRERQFPAFHQRMARIAMREYRMNILTNNLAAVQGYLRAHNAFADFPFPQPVTRLPASGGALLSWNGHPVSLVCFDLGQARDLYFFAIDHDAVSDGPRTSVPQFKQVGKLATAYWSAGGKTYLLAAVGEESLIRKFTGP